MTTQPRTRTPARTGRALAASALVLTVGAGLLVHGVLPDTTATDIAGDALYTVAAYLGLMLLFPRAASAAIGAVALAWCVGVELLQLTGIPLTLAAVFPPAVLVLGSGFDARDLLVYALAAIVATAVDLGVRRAATRPVGRH